VRIFLAEKGITVPTEQVDIMKARHKQPEFAAISPIHRLPVLVLDDGTAIAESIAICRYFEEVQPSPPLFGLDPVGRAQVEMWQRILEFELLGAIAAIFRHLHPAMAALEQPQVAAWGEANRDKLTRFLEILERHLAGRTFVCGETFSIADITGLVGIDFMKPSKLALPPEFGNVRRWHETLSARPSAKI
jgi:glutathione S-transferase